MKNKGIVVFASLTLCLLFFACCALLLFFCKFTISDVLSEKVVNYVNSVSGLGISFSSINDKSNDCVEINDLNIPLGSNSSISVSKTTLKASLFQIIGYFLGDKQISFNISLDSPVISIDLNDDLFLKGDGATKTDDFNIFTLINDLTSLISINDAEIHLFSEKYDISVNDADVLIDISKNLKINSLIIKSSSVVGTMDSNSFSVNELYISSEDGSEIAAKWDKIVFNEYTASSNYIWIKYLYSNDNIGISIRIPELSISSDVEDFVLENLFFQGNLCLTDMQFTSVLSVDKTIVSLNYRGFRNLRFSNIVAGLDNSNGLFNTQLNFQIEGTHDIKEIGTFGCSVILNASLINLTDFIDLSNYSELRADISNIYCDSFMSDNNISFALFDSDIINLSFYSDNSLNGSILYSLNNYDSDIRVYFNDFRISDYIGVFNYFENIVGRVSTENTSVDGSIILSGILNPKDISGRVSANIAGQNLIIAGSKQNIAVSFEAVSQNNIVDVDTLAISAMNKRLSYKGRVNLINYFPEGMLIFQDLSTFEELGVLEFELDDSKSSYSFNGKTSLSEYFDINGHVNFSNRDLILADSEVKTRYDLLQMNLRLDLLNRRFEAKSDQLDINVEINSDGMIDYNLILDDFGFYINESTSFSANAYAFGSYDTVKSVVDYNMSDFILRISDKYSIGFDLNVNNQKIGLSNIFTKFGDNEHKFDGYINLEYDSFADLYKFNLENIRFDTDLAGIGTDDIIKGYFIENSYSMSCFLDSYDINLEVLGSIENGFYSEIRVGDLTVEARYKDGIMTLFDGKGLYRSLVFDNISLSLDFKERNVIGSFDFVNEKENYDGIVKQGGTVEISAKLDSLVLGALNLAGIDVDFNFDIKLTGCYLGDEFRLADTDISVLFSKSSVSFSGNLINGTLNRDSKSFELSIDKNLLFGFNLVGNYDELELYFSDIYFPLPVMDQFLNTPLYYTIGGIIEGNLLVKRENEEFEFYGMLYSKAFNMGLFYIPEQNLNLKNVIITAYNKTFYLHEVPVIGVSGIDNRHYDASVSVELDISTPLSLERMDLYLNIPEDPIDLWIPLNLGETEELNIRGDVTGKLHFYYRNNNIGLDTDIVADNTDVTFKIEDKPEWMNNLVINLDADILLKTGKNVEFYYPNKGNAFVNFTVEEGESVNIVVDNKNKTTSATGEFSIKSGRISYIQNDFNITSGNFRLEKDIDDNLIYSINLDAKIKEYDYNGERMDIYLSLNNATLDDIRPRFSSIPAYTENEILQILASPVLPLNSDRFSFTSVANLALVAANTATNLGIVNVNNDYLLTNVIRDSLNLDVFTARSPIIENIILQSITESDSEINLLARYLNGTSVFAGKYIGKNFFARMTFLLKSLNNIQKYRNIGRFLSSDLNLDMEFSLEWDNPLGEFALFTKPQELSVYDFLDNIGFSFTKRFSF